MLASRTICAAPETKYEPVLNVHAHHRQCIAYSHKKKTVVDAHLKNVKIDVISPPPMFAGIGKVPYWPDAPPTEVFCFRHYDAQAMVRGRTMEDWLRFSVCFWHTFRGTGIPFQTDHTLTA